MCASCRKDYNTSYFKKAHWRAEDNAESHLYVMYCPLWKNLVKIGKARFPAARQRELAVGCPHLILYRVFDFEGTLEKPVQKLLEKVRYRVSSCEYECGGTEWFKLSPEDACTFIDAVIKLHAVGLGKVWDVIPKIYA